jgi:hypothetical protein
MSQLVRRAQYNPELILLDRWRVPYAPAYGWWLWVRQVWSIVTRTDPVYRRRSDDA